ncbi:hypothetical protein PENSPDRAFT_104469 [Peniophora sp. CONT]|nr:hypothetical protein PENSPDRAFT_104469 [Peniophora sp. CONT]
MYAFTDEVKEFRVVFRIADGSDSTVRAGLVQEAGPLCLVQTCYKDEYTRPSSPNPSTSHIFIMDSTLSLTMAPGEPACPASPFMMQDITFASVNTADASTWDLGFNEQLFPPAQPQDDLRDSIAELFGDEQPSTLAPQSSSSIRTIFGWRPSSSSKSHHAPATHPSANATSDTIAASSSSCLDMLTDALVPRKPNYKPVVSPGRLRIEQACEACRSRKAKCDGGQPCTRCKERGVSCAYKASKLTRSRRNSYSEFAAEQRDTQVPPRKSRSVPAPLHLAHSFLEPPQTQRGRRVPPPRLPFREPPSAASSTGSFLSGYSTAKSSARSTPMTADFPNFCSLNIDGPSGTGVMRHSRQNSRTHPYHAPSSSNHSSFYDPSASFVEGLPSMGDFTGWEQLQFPPQPIFEQPSEASFGAAGDEFSELFDLCAALPTESHALDSLFPIDAPPTLSLSNNPSESSNDSAESTNSFASFESSLMLEFAQSLNPVSADEKSRSMNTSPTGSPEEC